MQRNDHQTLIKHLDEAHSVDEIWALTVDYFTSQGIDFIIYVYCRGYKNTAEDTVFLSNIAKPWADRYVEKKYAEIDPFFTHCCNDYKPYKTGIAYYEDYDFLSDSENEFIREAHELCGFTSGTTVIMRRKGLGTDFGGWNLGTRLNRPQFDQLLADKYQHIRLIALYIHERLNILLQKDKDEVQSYLEQPLTPKQIESLDLLAKGFRTQQIADQMNIKPVTVEHHLKLAKERLKASTREQAVARAIIKGLITL